MKRDPADNLPVVGSTSSSELGARPGVDITVGAAGNVVLDASGMSVAPGWRNLDFTRGVIAPVQVVPFTQYQTDLENTRAAWQIDET
jgi:hypothetical protein